MIDRPSGTTSSGSPLGCCLHDWSVAAREAAGRRQSCRGLIIDLDDTLYPLDAFVRSGLTAIAGNVQERHGIPATDVLATLMTARREGPARQELQTLCRRYGLPVSCVPELLDLFRRHRPVLHLPRETAAVLTHLRATGWRIVVLTNGLPQTQRNKAAALGLEALVDAVVYADEEAPGGKPAAAAFAAALRHLSLPAGDCVCVGDDPARDIAGARALGMMTVWVAPAVSAPATVVDADVRIGSLAELRNVLPLLWRMRKRHAA